MFDAFKRLSDAAFEGNLQKELSRFLQERCWNPWDGQSLSGHVPYRDLGNSLDLLGREFSHPGFYFWGAWTGGHARLQYIGIAHGYSLEKRFKGRYVGAGRRAPHFGFRELRLAEEYGTAFSRLKDDFSPNRLINADKYRMEAIPVPNSGSHRRRLTRAERYAKTGLENVWFFLVPAPSKVSKKDLERVEKPLIQAATASLFESHLASSVNARPMLNIVHVKGRKVNPFVDLARASEYHQWLNGNW